MAFVGAPLAVGSPLARRLISASISAKGAQELIALDTPVSATRVAAKAREHTAGAQTMIAAKQKLDTSQAVTRSGWRLAARMSSDWVALERKLWDDLTTWGSRMEEVNVMTERAQGPGSQAG
jgi:hypothetical protein